MKSAFEQIIRNELKKTGDEDPSLRQAVYERIRRAIARKALRPDGTTDQHALRKLENAFDAALNIVESSYGEADLSLLDNVAVTKAGVGGLFGLAAAATGIAGIIDFFSVVLNDAIGLSAMAAYMLAGVLGAALTGILLVAPRFAFIRRQLRLGLRGSIAVALVGAVALGATMLSPQARERGLIAALVPGASNAQDAVLGRIEETSRQAAETLVQIEGKVDEVKKETSDDACKELANMGLFCSKRMLHDALNVGETRVVELHLKGGYSVEPYSIARLLFGPMYISNNNLESILKLIKKYPDRFDLSVCFKDKVELEPELGGASWDRFEFIDSHAPRYYFDFYNNMCSLSK